MNDLYDLFSDKIKKAHLENYILDNIKKKQYSDPRYNKIIDIRLSIPRLVKNTTSGELFVTLEITYDNKGINLYTFETYIGNGNNWLAYNYDENNIDIIHELNNIFANFLIREGYEISQIANISTERKIEILEDILYKFLNSNMLTSSEETIWYVKRLEALYLSKSVSNNDAVKIILNEEKANLRCELINDIL